MKVGPCRKKPEDPVPTFPLAVKAVGPSGFARTREITLSGPTGCDEAESLKASLNFGGAANQQDPTANLFYLPR